MNMNSLFCIRWLIVSAFALLLSACAGVGGPSAPSSVGPQVIDPTANGQLIDEYYSASGKHCQRYSQTTKDQIVVRCRQGSKQWQTAKSLEGIYTQGYLQMVQVANDRGLVASSTDADHVATEYSLLEDVSIEMDASIVDESSTQVPQTEIEVSAAKAPMEVQVQSGESLWNLSKRVSGSGSNWIAIAKANGLKNADHVWAGQILQIPQSVLAAN